MTTRQDSYATPRIFLMFLLIAVELSTFTSASYMRNCCDEDMTFYLYTPNNQDVGQQLLMNNTDSNLIHTNFVTRRPTKIIVHGYNQDMNVTFLVDIRKEYLKRNYYNVIAVDWHQQASGFYFMVENRLHRMGFCLAQLVELLRAHGATNIHMIGFGLGAHLAAFAAKTLRPYRLPRITGLDPAVQFQWLYGDNTTLDRTAADFVDVIHTDAWAVDENGFQLGLGNYLPVSHVDFYVNGGIEQPGCSSNVDCDHYRAAAYFAESINSHVDFWGFPCSRYLATTYSMNLCSRSYPAALMGEHVDINKVYDYIYVVETNEKSPYAKGMYTLD